MIKKVLKKNKGISMMDIGIAITLFAIFAGLVGNLYYQIAFNNLRVRYEGIVVYNVVRLAEYIDLMEYEDVVSKSKSQLMAMQYTSEELQSLENNTSETKHVLDFPNDLATNDDDLTMNMEVESYVDAHPEDTENILKTVTITVTYKIMGKEYEYSVQKLKYKEKVSS